MTTCQGKSGNLELCYNTPHHTLTEFTQMMGKFGGGMWMMFCRTILGLSLTNLEFQPWRQQPQLIQIPNQLSLLNPVHIHLMTQINWRQLLPPQVLCCVDHPALPNLLLLLLLLTDCYLTSLLVLSSRDTQFETCEHYCSFSLIRQLFCYSAQQISWRRCYSAIVPCAHINTICVVGPLISCVFCL